MRRIQEEWDKYMRFEKIVYLREKRKNKSVKVSEPVDYS